jgi:SulP family sulfate permease
VVIDAEAIGDVDSTGAGVLADLADTLGERGITLSFARLKATISAYLGRAGVMEKIGPEHVYLEVDDAVAAFVTAPHEVMPPASMR